MKLEILGPKASADVVISSCLLAVLANAEQEGP